MLGTTEEQVILQVHHLIVHILGGMVVEVQGNNNGKGYHNRKCCHYGSGRNDRDEHNSNPDNYITRNCDIS